MNELRDAKHRNVGRELARRQDCRYGLRGVRVRHVDVADAVFVVESSEWSADRELVLDLIPEGAKVRTFIDGVEWAPKPGLNIISGEALLKMECAWPDGSLRQTPAAKCELIDDWPVVCDCWREEAQR